MSDAGAAPLPAVEVHGLEKTYDDGLIRALDGVDLIVAAQEFAAITGHSGCGKSTLLHLIAALDTPSKGTITVSGHDVVHLRHASRFRREEVGLVFQLHNLLPRLSVRENVEIAMSGSRRPHRQRAGLRRRAARRGRPRWPERPPPDTAVGGRAPEGRHRTGPGQRPAAAAGRRADRQSRHRLGRRGARALPASAPGAPYDDRAGHPRRGRGERRRPHRAHGRRKGRPRRRRAARRERAPPAPP